MNPSLRAVKHGVSTSRLDALLSQIYSWAEFLTLIQIPDTHV